MGGRSARGAAEYKNQCKQATKTRLGSSTGGHASPREGTVTHFKVHKTLTHLVCVVSTPSSPYKNWWTHPSPSRTVLSYPTFKERSHVTVSDSVRGVQVRIAHETHTMFRAMRHVRCVVWKKARPKPVTYDVDYWAQSKPLSTHQQLRQAPDQIGRQNGVVLVNTSLPTV